MNIAPLSSSSRSEPRPNLHLQKEWIVPPKAKPGRKPTVRDESDPTPNRSSAQKVTRERKKEQSDVMAERIRRLENGEGDKLVFFQQQALKAKEESASLRAQNEYLQRTVDDLRRQLSMHQGCGGSDRSGPPVAPLVNPPAPKRRRVSTTRVPSPPAPLEAAIQSSSTSTGDVCCGLCSSSTSCFCSDVGFEIDHSLPPPPPTVASTYAIALPLRTRKSPNFTPIWPTEPVGYPTSPSFSPALVTCSGDPSSCPACQNDPLGQAFCRSLSEQVCSVSPCANCPSKRTSSFSTPALMMDDASQNSPVDLSEIEMMDDSALRSALADLPCCGAPGLCGSLCRPTQLEDASLLPKSVQPGVRSQETLPCNEAWTALKCHPNIAFASMPNANSHPPIPDLQMLADVVARRTHCDGPSLDFGSSFDSRSSQSLHMGLASIGEEAPSRAVTNGKRLTVERAAVDDALLYLDSRGPNQ